MKNHFKVDLKARAKELKSDIPALFLALKRKDTPIAAKIMAAITVGYALSPIDLIPDFIPVLGYLDDIILVPILIAVTVKLIPKEILAEVKQEAESLWSAGKPKKWYYAIPIVFVWMIILFLIIKAILF